MLNITEVRVKLIPAQRDKLLAFASVTIDDSLVIRDIKIIEGNERTFVAMPSRKVCDRCTECGGKNYVRARYCSDCGARLESERTEEDERGRARLYADVAHPIHQDARDHLSGAILEAYKLEATKAAEQGDAYQAAVDDHEAWDGFGVLG
jgi:stage V sporulation protein G